jgi:hypothetical protein
MGVCFPVLKTEGLKSEVYGMFALTVETLKEIRDKPVGVI